MTKKRRRRHTPEQIVSKLRDADAMLNVGKELQQSHSVSERRACQVVGQPRSSHRYIPQVPDDEPQLVADMLQVVREFHRYGYRMVTHKLRQKNWTVNAKRVYRLWRREGLKVPKKQRKTRHSGQYENGCDHHPADHPDDVWAWDFVFDRTSNGTMLKWLVIVDEFTRECLCLRVDRSITSDDVGMTPFSVPLLMRVRVG